MALENEIGEAQPDVKSENDNLVSFILFQSRIQRPVEVLWVNYEGKVVNFRTLGHTEVFEIQTYVSHPWIAWDAETHQRYLLNGRPVHFPSPFDPDNPIELVTLDLPVYSLKECGLQAVRSCINIENENLECLEIPRTLLCDLRNPPSPGFKYQDD